MYQQEVQLQRLKARFRQWLPWLKTATRADISITSTGTGNAFNITARWQGGEHTKLYDRATVLQQGRVRCVKDYARTFVEEVY